MNFSKKYDLQQDEKHRRYIGDKIIFIVLHVSYKKILNVFFSNLRFTVQ
jgi:hypothetical protein